jgi:predicted alpha/beta-fold hydrolase
LKKNQLSITDALSGHFQTILPYLFRRVKLPESEQIEITLPDGDFVDAEFWKGNGNGLAILSHGLEGNTKAVYLKALCKSYLDQGWDVLAWNFRGCSGRINKTLRLYHSGAYEDLQSVVEFASLRFSPLKIHMAGFSLGANLTLVFLAKMGKEWLEKMHVEKGLAISPPLNLAASSKKLDTIWNRPYRFNFLRALKNKIKEKAKQFPKEVQLKHLDYSKTIFDFDDYYTAPMHGFAGATDYYKKCSSLYHLVDIEIPTMIIIAKNDPMLGRGNYEGLEKINPKIRIQILDRGGHCGFWGMGIF